MDTVHNVLIYGTYIFLFLVSAFLVMITLGTESSPHKEKQSVERAHKRKPRFITNAENAQKYRMARLRRRTRCGGVILRHRSRKGAW